MNFRRISPAKPKFVRRVEREPSHEKYSPVLYRLRFPPGNERKRDEKHDTFLLKTGYLSFVFMVLRFNLLFYDLFSFLLFLLALILYPTKSNDREIFSFYLLEKFFNFSNTF